MQETRNTFDALDWKCHVKRPLTYSGYCCLGLFGSGARTEMTKMIDTLVIFFISYIRLYCLLLHAQHCCHLLFVKVE